MFTQRLGTLDLGLDDDLLASEGDEDDLDFGSFSLLSFEVVFLTYKISMTSLHIFPSCTLFFLTQLMT
jgi:hypothetical protein